jgi:peptidoglycan/LPS O-acetylase OafA/YrhL
MAEPWFNPNLYAWIPGTALGCLGGAFGAVVGFAAPRGKARKAVMGIHAAFTLISLVLLIAGAAALAAGQPYGIWYAFALPGLIGTVVFAAVRPVIKRPYADAEMRKSKAADL